MGAWPLSIDSEECIRANSNIYLWNLDAHKNDELQNTKCFPVTFLANSRATNRKAILLKVQSFSADVSINWASHMPKRVIEKTSSVVWVAWSELSRNSKLSLNFDSGHRSCRPIDHSRSSEIDFFFQLHLDLSHTLRDCNQLVIRS